MWGVGCGVHPMAGPRCVGGVTAGAGGRGGRGGGGDGVAMLDKVDGTGLYSSSPLGALVSSHIRRGRSALRAKGAKRQ